MALTTTLIAALLPAYMLTGGAGLGRGASRLGRAVSAGCRRHASAASAGRGTAGAVAAEMPVRRWLPSCAGVRHGCAARMLAMPASSDAPDPGSLKVSELKLELARRGLPVGGVKSELVERLRASSGGPSSRAAQTRAGRKPTPPAADGPTVLIVESPAKISTIRKFVGDRYELLACSGHVRALPSKPGSVRPEAGFDMSFELAPGAGRVMQAICAATRRASRVLLAMDPDREGEAIAWHVWQLLLQRRALPAGLEVERVTFGEITRSAVTAAIAAPRPIDMPLVQAQQARQAVDYLVGFTLSPVLWRKLPGCRSAGRVQSVALRLIVEREEEVLRFRPHEYWWLALAFGQPGDAAAAFAAEPTELRGERLRKLSLASSSAAAEAQAAMLGGAPWSVAAVRRTARRLSPPAPYNTASMQLDASSRLGVPVGVIMRLAQKLYEGVPIGGEPRALITYMRTDSHQMSDEAVAAARQYIGAHFAPDFLPDSPRLFADRRKKNAQEAHEAIRPVDFAVEPASLAGAVPERELALYELIWRRALASQMSQARHETLAIHMRAAGGAAAARASASRRLFAGFEEVLRPDGGDGAETARVLESLAEGDELALLKAEPSQHWTTPPPRYSEGGLVKRLEQLGVGRPSTYAMIMRVLQDRGYAELDARALRPLPRGQMLTALLVSQLERYVQYEYTARLEEDLGAAEAGLCCMGGSKWLGVVQTGKQGQCLKARGHPGMGEATSLLDTPTQSGCSPSQQPPPSPTSQTQSRGASWTCPASCLAGGQNSSRRSAALSRPTRSRSATPSPTPWPGCCSRPSRRAAPTPAPAPGAAPVGWRSNSRASAPLSDATPTPTAATPAPSAATTSRSGGDA